MSTQNIYNKLAKYSKIQAKPTDVKQTLAKVKLSLVDDLINSVDDAKIYIENSESLVNEIEQNNIKLTEQIGYLNDSMNAFNNGKENLMDELVAIGADESWGLPENVDGANTEYEAIVQRREKLINSYNDMLNKTDINYI